MYDVIVVGAGPAGCRTAARLAAAGHHVLILERGACAGENVCCTGIIGRECLTAYEFPDAVRLHAASGARLFSPGGDSTRIVRESVQAEVIDRAAADAWLAAKATRAGAEILFHTSVASVLPDDRGVTVTAAGGATYRGRAAVIASGYGRGLTARSGLGRNADAAIGVQSEVSIDGLKEIEVYLGREVAPGFFAWVVPLAPGRARVGLISRHGSGRRLGLFLERLRAAGRIKDTAVARRFGGIPLRPLRRTYAPHLLAVGDAAGQVKPFTGGGVYYALLGADIAADVLSEALARDDLSATSLAAYQRRWQHLLKREFRYGYAARRILERLNDGHLDRVFAIIKEKDIAARLADNPELSFDWHAAVIRALAGRLAGSAAGWRLAKSLIA